jgi:hypothetical protein
MNKTFAEHLSNYLTYANEAHRLGRHHDQRGQLFLGFLREAFHLHDAEFELEKFIKIDLRKRGWIDTLFRNVIFEFKTVFDKERAEGKRELKDYLTGLPEGQECIGILTDGLTFEVYRLATTELILIDNLNLNKESADAVYHWLDAYLFTQTNTPPTTEDIVQRYGALSPSFQIATQILTSLFNQEKDAPSLQTKIQQWRSVLAKAYGTDVTSDTLFIRHTYLSQFAKLLAYCALTPLNLPYEDETLAEIVTGEAFYGYGVNNLGEMDFFHGFLKTRYAQRR